MGGESPIFLALNRNKRSLAYIHGILKSWQAGGYDDEKTKPSAPKNSKKEAIDAVNSLMAEYAAQEGKEKDDDDDAGIDPATDWSFTTGV